MFYSNIQPFSYYLSSLIFVSVEIKLVSILSILCVKFYAIYKKTPAYEDFTQGASEGFKIAVKIIPYLIAIMVCVSALRASGAIEIAQKLDLERT